MVKWRGRRRSSNVEDRRGAGGGMAGLSGLSGRSGLIGLAIPLLRFVIGRFGITGIVVLVGGYFALQAVGIDPLMLLQQGPLPAQTQHRSSTPNGLDDDSRAFVSVILAETEDSWGRRFAASGQRYEAPRLVLFSGQTRSGCGAASSAIGPFYCPLDKTIYLDTTFFDDLARRFGAPGDFAAAYVIAHEVAHHVQELSGLLARVRAAKDRSSKTQSNALQVRVELQADCYAGIWAHDADRTANILEMGDIEEGLEAASAIGDDTLQRRSGRQVQPESFTHGSSAQRVEWFTRGYKTGDIAQCDTFAE